MNIASLFAKLGIDIDAAAFAAADAKLQALRARAEEVMQRVRSNTEHFDQVVLDIGRQVRAASGQVNDAIVDWTKGAKKGIDWTKAWEKTVAGVGKAYKFARKAVLGIVVGGAVLKGLGHLADAYTGARSRINQLTDDTARQKRLQDELFASAQNTATAYGDVVGVYQQVAVAAKANGRTLEQGVIITDTINKALASSGATGEGASQALRQLGQALGSGTLRGEEFNAVIEQAPGLIDIIAKSMHKTRGQMRAMAEGGQITSKVILKALEQQKDAVDAAYAKRIPQVGDLFVRLRNTISKALSEIFQKKEVVAGLTSAFKALTAVMVGVIQATAAVALWLGRNPELVQGLIVALSALTAGFVAMKIEAAIAWLVALSPIALIAAGIIGLVAVFVIFRKQIGKAVDWAATKLESLWSSIKRIPGLVGSAFSAMGRTIKGVFLTVVNGIIGAINWAIRKVNWVIRKLNKLPFVSLGTIGEIDKLGAKGKATPATDHTEAIRAIAKGTGTGIRYTDVSLEHMRALAASASASRRPSTTLPTRPLATMPTVARGGVSKQVIVNNNAAPTININGAGDPEAVGRVVDRRWRELRDQDMHAAMAGLDEGEAA